MVFGELDDFPHRFEVESIHGAGIIAHGFGGEHDRHAGQTARAHALVALNLLSSLVVGSDGGHKKVLDWLRCVLPVAARILFPRGLVSTHDDEKGSIRDLGLIPGHGTNLLPHFRIDHGDETPMLNVERSRRQHGCFEQLTNFFIRHAMIGIIMLDRTAGLDGFEGIHGWFVVLGALGVEFDMEVYVVVDHVFAEKGKKATRAVMAAELSAIDFELGLASEVVGIGGSYDS